MGNVTRWAALKKALVHGLRERPELAGVQILGAEPGAERAANTGIWFVGEDFIEQEWATIGQHSRDEAITLTGAVFVRIPGAGQEAIEAAADRAAELVGEIEEFCTGTGADPTLGGIVKALRCRPAEASEIADPAGRVVLLRFEIRTQLTRLVRN